jgi:hypothetical protein
MASYKRKTVDEYQLWTNYGYGWENETIEETWKAAKEQKKCYLDNATNLIGIKIIKKRIKLESKGE